MADRSARRACVLVLLTGVLLLHREVLFSGSVYHMDDAADSYYPSHVAIARAYGEGRLPTWERSTWCGFPLLADPYYGAYYPLNLVFVPAGMVRGLGITIVLHTLLAGAGMFLLLRRRRLDFGPALLGAVSVAFGSFMVERIRHVIFAQLLAWLPLLLALVEGYLATRKRRELVLLSGAVALALLAGALPLLPYVVLLLLAYAVPRLLREEGRLGAAMGLLGAAVVGFLLAMAQIVPTLAHLPYSPRSLRADYTFASSYAWPDLRYLATLVAPNVLGVEAREHWFGAYNHWEMAGYYAGALVVLLAPLAFLRKRAPELIGLFLVSLVAILLAFGDRGGLHRLFFRFMPLYAGLRCPTRALVMALVALPILAAEGLTALSNRATPKHGAVAATAAAVLAITGCTLGLFLSRRPPALPESAFFVRSSLGHLVAVLGCAGALVVLRKCDLLSARRATLGVAMLTLVDLLGISRGLVQPQPADFAEGTDRFAAVDWLLAHREGDRFAPWGPWGPFRLLNASMTYDLESASGYDSFSVWRYVNLLQVINTGAPYPWKRLKHDLAAGRIERFGSPLVDLLNVRYVIGAQKPGPDWIVRFAPTPGDPPHARHEADWDGKLSVYENPHVLPRAFVVYRAEVEPNADARAQKLATLDPRKTVLLDRTPDPAPVPGGGAGTSRQPPFTPARLAVAERDHLVIEADALNPGVLVVSEVAYPGWSATVDGKAAALLEADYAFRGVALPAGRHTVEMRFASRPARIGLAGSGVGLFALVGLAMAGRARRSERT